MKIHSKNGECLKDLFNSFHGGIREGEESWHKLLEDYSWLVFKLNTLSYLPPPDQEDKDYAKSFVMSFFENEPREEKNKQYHIKLNKMQLLKLVRDSTTEHIIRIIAVL